VPELTTPYARRTPPLRGVLEKIALALGGRPGARTTRLLAAEVSRTTLLRLVRALPVPEVGTITVVGVDLSRAWGYPAVVRDGVGAAVSRSTVVVT
jgi:hypothetical protein